jgi:hypothetical protein
MMPILLLGALYLLWVIIPLIPAVLIYRLFPNTAVAVSGPFANLTVKAGGAFAAYLVVFAATLPLVNTMRDSALSTQHQFWTLKGQVRLFDAEGKEIKSSELLKKLSLTTVPNAHAFDLHRMTVKVVEGEGELPLITLRIDKFGEETIDLRDASFQKMKNYFSGVIELAQPIQIREVAASTKQSIQPRTDTTETESTSSAR